MAEDNGSKTNVQNPPAEGAPETTEKVISESKDDMARPTEGDTASQKSYSSVIERFMDRGLTVMNPCKCCMRCCGKNALRIGTFVVAALYIVNHTVSKTFVMNKYTSSHEQEYSIHIG